MGVTTVVLDHFALAMLYGVEQGETPPQRRSRAIHLRRYTPVDA